MRKINAFLTFAIILMLLVHMGIGSLNLFEISYVMAKWLARVTITLVAFHMVLSCILTIKSLKVMKKTGAPYFRENTLFWGRRISGLAFMILIPFHMFSFGHTENGKYVLDFFSPLKLALSLLFLLLLSFHTISNVKPVLISLGIRKLKRRTGDIIFIVSLILLVSTVAFIVYFLKWNSI